MASEEVARSSPPKDPDPSASLSSFSRGGPAAAGERDSAPEAANKTPIGLVREPGVIQRVVCAVFAWAVTVAPYVLGRTGSWAGRLVAVLALATGVAGPLLVPTKRRIGRHVGITAFLASTTLVWLLCGRAISIQRLDPILATIGALAWGVFAFSWGEPWSTRDEPQQTDELGGMLRARAQLPPLAVPIAAIGVLAGLGLMSLAWRVRDPSRALLAQAAGVGLGVALVSAAAHIAISRGKSRSAQSTVPRTARRAILVLVLAAVLGGGFLILRTAG